MPSSFGPRLAVALLVVGLLLPWLARPASAQETGPKITDIIVVGNKGINRESIIATSGLKIGDVLTKAMLDEAQRRLLLTQNFQPDDGVRVEAQVDGEEAKVVISVRENDIVLGFNITGAGPIPVAEIQKLLQTTPGRPLNLVVLRSDLEKIRQLYESRGYAADIDPSIGIENGILNIPIVVATIGKIKINNLRKTREFVIRREMELKPGDYFRQKTFEDDLRRVYNTDLFDNVDPAFSYPNPGMVDINLNVQEKRTGTVSVFVGYSSRNRLVGGAELGENNFLGRGQAVSLRWDTGGLANRNSFEVGFTEPWLDKRHTSLSVNLYDKTIYRFAQRVGSIGGTTGGNEGDYYEVRTGGQLTLSRPFRNTYRGFIGLRHDNVRVADIAVNEDDAIALQNGPLTALNFRVTHNTRDYDIDPVAGGYEIYSVDIGRADLRPVKSAGNVTNPITGNVTFQKLQLDMRRYFTLRGGPRKNPQKDKRHSIALRLVAGTSLGTMPFFEQFFVGGAETLRGYREDRFWGKNMVLASTEYRAPLASGLTGVFFVDVGDAWSGPYEKIKLSGFSQHAGFSPSVGFGLGLRVITPIGPIRIDQGFGSEGARTHFSIGHVF
jgi:outer membrane protein insertion porin family